MKNKIIEPVIIIGIEFEYTSSPDKMLLDFAQSVHKKLFPKERLDSDYEKIITKINKRIKQELKNKRACDEVNLFKSYIDEGNNGFFYYGIKTNGIDVKTAIEYVDGLKKNFPEDIIEKYKIRLFAIQSINNFS